MISDPDIFRAAQLLIDGCGEYAAPLANFRGEELRIRGYVEASELWRQVVAAIDELQHGRRGDDGRTGRVQGGHERSGFRGETTNPGR